MGVHSYTFNPIPASFVDDVNKAHAVVMIVNSETGEIPNAQIASIQSDASIAEMNNDFELNLYPNPQFDLLTVSNLFTKSRATVRNVLGNETIKIDVFSSNSRGQMALLANTLNCQMVFISYLLSSCFRLDKKDLLSRINEF